MSRTVIGIITYRRPVGLKRLLDSLVSELTPSGDCVIVIDNDSMRSAESICNEYNGTLDLLYDIEPRRGVSAPRNKVLDLAGDAESIIFLDDDEWVERGWYDQILASSRRFPDALVTGPVKYVLPSSKQSWADRAGYFQTHNHPHESIIQTTGAGNTLIPTAALRRLTSPHFDDAYSHSGGEDQELFGRLQQAGCDIRWSSGAIVGEEVPPSRATQRWIHKRFARSGYIRGRVMLQNRKSSVTVGIHGVLRLCFGGASFVLALRTWNDRGARAKATATALSGLGFLLAAVRRPVEAYGVASGEGR